MTNITIPITPVPKPRMTQSDKWKKRPAVLRYRDYKDHLNLLVKGSLEATFDVVFYVPMPTSWSETKKRDMEGKPHQQKPDIDNYLKAFMDALCEDDSYVYDVRARKYWAREGRIELSEG